jgi:Tol biopolymer transport system component
VWLPGGDGLLVSGSIPGDTPRSQVWRLSTEEGTLQRITNDPNDYQGVSLSADGTVLVTVLAQSVGHLYVAPTDDPDSIRQLTHGSRERVGCVDAEGSSVVFQRAPDGQKWELWGCDDDGSDLRRLNTDGSEVVPDGPGVSGVGGEILFTARGPDNLRQIWRIDDSGRRPSQVTATESGAGRPSLAPDGTWFVYKAANFGTEGTIAQIWRQSTGGGDPVLLAADASFAVISPDGKHVAIDAWRDDDEGSSGYYYEVIPAEGGAPVISIVQKGVMSFGGLRWRPDGQALTFFGWDDGQVWLQPLDGGPPEQLTHFENGLTLSHAWSPDGKWLYLVRSENTRDAVLIRNF